MTSDAISRGAYLVTIRCSLVFEGPLHVGTGERLSIETDAPLMRDALDNPILPGSSVRGVLRDWCEREAAPLNVKREAVDRLFGVASKRSAAVAPANGNGANGNAADGHADDRQGRLAVIDSEFRKSTTAVRDHVRIDRSWGAASKGGKFDREIAEIRTGVLVMTYEGDGPGDEELRLLSAALLALEQGALAFGGNTGSGFGAVRATGVQWEPVNRANLDGLAAYCTRRLQPSAAPEKSAPEPARRPLVYGKPRAATAGEPKPWAWLSMNVELQFDGPMLVAGPNTSDNPNAHEFLADAAYVTDNSGHPTLPGSTLRGVLRSYAERIAQSLDEPARKVVDRLFGPALDKEDGPKAKQGLVRVGLGRLATPKKTILSRHVAIDRVTGFAVDKRLFSDVALASPRFKCRLFLRWHEDEPTDRAAIALFFITLRDVEAGLVWLGSRTTRGYGRIAQLILTEATTSRLERFGGEKHLWTRASQQAISAKSVIELAGSFTEAVAEWKAFALGVPT
jgi:CRISPR/Cas system CMR subunit Cmr4 (Cas7 group RAMP superfamily)